jgi:protoporphyrinogen/coproporphyrinogen III oxidase
MALGLMAFNMSKGTVYTMKRGLGSIPEAMASRLSDLRLNTRVLSVTRVGNAKVAVESDAGNFEASYVILATPAPLAKRILVDPIEIEPHLLNTEYGSTINVSLATRKRWSSTRKDLKDVYGFLIPRKEAGLVGAIGIETNKFNIQSGNGDLFSVMTKGAKTNHELLAMSDQAIVSAMAAEMDAYFPGISADITMSRVYRWPLAQTLSPVGRGKAVQSYQNRVVEYLPVVLAGDYLGVGSTDSAALTGKWAAQTILAASRG